MKRASIAAAVVLTLASVLYLFGQTNFGGPTQPAGVNGSIGANSGTAGAIALYPAAGGSNAIGPDANVNDNGTVFAINEAASFGSAAQATVTALGRFNKYNNISLPAVGVPYEVGTAANLTAQSATAGPTNLSAGLPLTGQYEVKWYIDERAACATPGSGQVSLVFNWTDSTLARQSTAVVLPFDATDVAADFKSGVTPLFGTSGSVVTYTATYTACTSGTATYDLHAILVETQ